MFGLNRSAICVSLSLTCLIKAEKSSRSLIEVILEALSILALTWLQMQRHNVSNVFQMNFLDILFRIPEKYQCNLGSIRQGLTLFSSLAFQTCHRVTVTFGKKTKPYKGKIHFSIKAGTGQTQMSHISVHAITVSS